MFGVKFQLNRPLYLILLLFCISFLLIQIFLKRKESIVNNSILSEDDETINLVDLFTNAFRLTYQAGYAIRSFKNSQNESLIFQKKNSLTNQSTEPVTFADLLSHSILNDGLKSIYKNLQVNSINHQIFYINRNYFDFNLI